MSWDKNKFIAEFFQKFAPDKLRLVVWGLLQGGGHFIVLFDLLPTD